MNDNKKQNRSRLDDIFDFNVKDGIACIKPEYAKIFEDSYKAEMKAIRENPSAMSKAILENDYSSTEQVKDGVWKTTVIMKTVPLLVSFAFTVHPLFVFLSMLVFMHLCYSWIKK